MTHQNYFKEARQAAGHLLHHLEWSTCEMCEEAVHASERAAHDAVCAIRRPRHTVRHLLDWLPAPMRRGLEGWRTTDEEHLFRFKYWHFLDLGTDLGGKGFLKPVTQAMEGVAAAHPERLAGPLGRLLPFARLGLRAIPIVGVIGEGLHVITPWKNAFNDWQDGKLSTRHFAGLSALYLGYTASGVFGLGTVAIKEIATNAVQHHHGLDDRYLPHSLYREFHHTGWIKGDENDDLIALAERHLPKIQLMLGHIAPPTHPRDPRCSCCHCQRH